MTELELSHAELLAVLAIAEKEIQRLQGEEADPFVLPIVRAALLSARSARGHVKVSYKSLLRFREGAASIRGQVRIAPPRGAEKALHPELGHTPTATPPAPSLLRDLAELILEQIYLRIFLRAPTVSS
jgi:hypothetical protein